MLTHVTVKGASFANFLVMFGLKLMSNSNVKFYAQTKTNPTQSTKTAAKTESL